jgi:cellulose synthase/poly-beta-1,6-N-acetylglucosamine synthase-like glycosyltransferase
VSFIIPAHNEELVLTDKLKNTLAVNYPRDRIEIIVASDASTDATVEIAERFTAQGVRVLANMQRRGKASVVNDAAAVAQGEVLCLCDANVLFRSDALGRLVSQLADPRIGAASGDVRLMSHESNFGAGESLYYRIERWIQLHESRAGSMMGVDGGMYVVRRELFLPLRDDTILDDFVTSMRVIKQGKRIVYDPEAIATENGTPLARQEFRRRIRVTAGAVQAFKRGEFPRIGQPIELWQFTSHKFLRWGGPIWLLAIAVSSVGLVGAGPIYQSALIAQSVLYAAAVWATVNMGFRRTQLGGAIFYFVMSHVAMAIGLVKGLFNLQKGTWKRTDRRWGAQELEPKVGVALPKKGVGSL